MAKEFITSSEISDVMIERPVSFSIKGKHYSVFPATLGKIQLYSRLLQAAGIEEAIDAAQIYSRILESSQQHRSECLRIVAYSTLPGTDCLDENKVQKRLKELDKIDDVDIASLLLITLTQDKSELIKKQFAMDVEAKRMSDVLKAKKDNKNTFTFGCRSMWGAIIDAACERYGWTYQYVLWGVSYSNLMLMLADQSRSVYLTDEERKNVHVSNDRNVVRAENTEELENLIKTQSWK